MHPGQCVMSAPLVREWHEWLSLPSSAPIRSATTGSALPARSCGLEPRAAERARWRWRACKQRPAKRHAGCPGQPAPTCLSARRSATARLMMQTAPPRLVSAVMHCSGSQREQSSPWSRQRRRETSYPYKENRCPKPGRRGETQFQEGFRATGKPKNQRQSSDGQTRIPHTPPSQPVAPVPSEPGDAPTATCSADAVLQQVGERADRP